MVTLPTDPVNPVILNTVVEMYYECVFDYNSPSIDELLNQFSDTIETLLGIRGHDLVNPTYVPRYLIDATLDRLIIMCPNSDIVMHEICGSAICDCFHCVRLPHIMHLCDCTGVA